MTISEVISEDVDEDIDEEPTNPFCSNPWNCPCETCPAEECEGRFDPTECCHECDEEW